MSDMPKGVVDGKTELVRWAQSIADRYVFHVPPWVVEDRHITLVGCGATGSYTAMLLAKASFKHFHLIDPDVVEAANVGVQLYNLANAKCGKAATLAGVLEVQGVPEDNITPNIKKFEDGDRWPRGTDVMILGPDNLEARRAVYNAMPHSTHRRKLFLDARIGPNNIELWATTVGKAKRWRAQYEKSLEGDVKPQPCGAEGSPWAGPIVASIITLTVVQWARRKPVPGLTHIDVSSSSWDEYTF